MIPPKRIEIGWAGLARAFLGGLLPGNRQSLTSAVEGSVWEGQESLAVLSVRSGLDLLLHALRLPAGSEVLVSAITISDMPRILRKHGLVPVPVDLDMESLSVSSEALAAAVTPRTRAILVAHVFGARMRLAEAGEVARKHDLLLIEDCAQAYDGVFRGSEEADVVMFSFGPIKTQTALGGGVLRVRRPTLLAEMRRIHETWPAQPRSEYLRRVLKYGVILAVLARPMYGAFTRLLGRRHQQILKSAVRGFPGPELYRRIRRRPSTALLATLARRLRNPDLDTVATRRTQGRALRDLLSTVFIPGRGAPHHSFWVFPVCVPDPEQAMERVRALGIDPSRGTTSLTVVHPPDGRRAACEASRVMAGVLFLPLGPGLTNDLMTAVAAQVNRRVRDQEPSHG